MGWNTRRGKARTTERRYTANGSNKDGDWGRVLHGTLSQHCEELARLNAAGAGVFVMVNEGDGKGRAENNVRALRALFVDDDTNRLRRADLKLMPSIIVQSKAGLHA